MSASKSKGVELIADRRVKLMAAELEPEHGVAEANAGPITIVSDGTPEGTSMSINGVAVNFDSMDIYCYKDGEYPSCSISVTVKDTDDDGMEVRRTMTLRKEESPKSL